MPERFVALANPKITVLLCIVICVLTSIGAQNLYFRGDYRIFFSEDNAELKAFEEMEKVFSKNDNVSILIGAPDTVFETKALSLIKSITDDSWTLPFASRVDSITNFQHTWSEEDDLIVEDLLYDIDDLTNEKISRIRQIALSEPNLVDKLVSQDGTVALVNVLFQFSDGDKTEEVKQVAQALKELLKKYEISHQEFEFHEAGIVMVNFSFVDEAEKDGQTLIPGMFMVVIVLMAFLIRNAYQTIASVLVIILTIASAMGIAGWLGYFLSASTVNLPIILVTLAVADCVHIVMTIKAKRAGLNNYTETVAESLKINSSPIIITSVTTALGFLTLNFSDVPILRDLGNLAAIGVMIACGLSLYLLPALLLIFPEGSNKELKFGNNLTNTISAFVLSKYKALLPLAAILMLGFTSLISLNKISDDPTSYFDDSTDFRQATNFQKERLSGITTVDFALYTGKEYGITEPAFLSNLEAFIVWLNEQPEVDHVTSITHTFKRLNKNLNQDDPAFYKLPENKELASQYLLLYEMSLPYGLDLNNQINLDKSATRLVATMQNLGSKEFVEFEARAKAFVADIAPDVKVTAASPALIFAHIGERNMRSMLFGSVTALLIISGLLVFALRSLKLGAISLIPNLFPAAVGFGIWALYSGEINVALSVVTSICLGIIVDDTVHFLSKYNHALKNGQSVEDSINYAYKNVGSALIVTTIILVAGFLVLAMSSFRLNSDMGTLTAMIIFIALLIDLLFLPAFLLAFNKKRKAA